MYLWILKSRCLVFSTGQKNVNATVEKSSELSGRMMKRDGLIVHLLFFFYVNFQSTPIPSANQKFILIGCPTGRHCKQFAYFFHDCCCAEFVNCCWRRVSRYKKNFSVNVTVSKATYLMYFIKPIGSGVDI